MMKKAFITLFILVAVINELYAVEIRSIGQEVSIQETSNARFSAENHFDPGELVVVYDSMGAPRYAEVGTEKNQTPVDGLKYEVFMKDEDGKNFSEFLEISQLGKIPRSQ